MSASMHTTNITYRIVVSYLLLDLNITDVYLFIYLFNN